LAKLKARMKRKAALFPDRWNLTGLDRIRGISQFDDRYTAPDGGYASGIDYYDRAGSRHVLGEIAVPTTIITAQNDPFIPYSMFSIAAITQNSHIVLRAPQHGGHCGFVQQYRQDEDRFWVENRIIESIRAL
jgi:hypothetical protein